MTKHCCNKYLYCLQTNINTPKHPQRTVFFLRKIPSGVIVGTLIICNSDLDYLFGCHITMQTIFWIFLLEYMFQKGCSFHTKNSWMPIYCYFGCWRGSKSSCGVLYVRVVFYPFFLVVSIFTLLFWSCRFLHFPCRFLHFLGG